MKSEIKSNYYVGLDIGTNSVGYAVTKTDYTLCRAKGNPMQGVTLFEEANKCDERRAFRTARRRLDRRQQRVQLIRELFADEIAKVDEKFYIKIDESSLFDDDKTIKATDDDWYLNEYTNKYKTIHHLLVELMTSNEKHDIRLIYIACAWLVAHRGHFLNEINEENIEQLVDTNRVYSDFMQWFIENGYSMPWECNPDAFVDILLEKDRILNKEKKIYTLINDGKKPVDNPEVFPYSKAAIVRLLCGGSVKLSSLLLNESDVPENDKSIQLSKPDDLEEILPVLDEGAELLVYLSKIYDCTLLSKTLSGEEYISKVKVNEYEQHKNDLRVLKCVLKKYLSKNAYRDFFNNAEKKGYTAYVANYKSDKNKKDRGKCKKITKEDFYDTLKKQLKNIEPQTEEDKKTIDDILDKIEIGSYMPKQVDSDNRVIPYQLYYVELKRILDNASKHYPFLNRTDAQNISVASKIKSVFTFRIPYYIGPLNSNSPHAWIEKKSDEKIYPWNFESVVDFDKCEIAFIERMTNKCSYLPGESVLPQNSVLYNKFTVLNEINNIKINDVPISVELKQELFNNLFMPNNSEKIKVTRKRIENYLISNGYVSRESGVRISGIDTDIKSSMKSMFDFYALISSGKLSLDDVESIIEHSTYVESKKRLKKWVSENYNLDNKDIEFIVSKKYKDFGRLSKKLLNGIEGVNKETGEIGTVMYFLWNTNDNLMQIVADENKYTFKNAIETLNEEYYSETPKSLNDKLDEMYISNGVKRSIFRTLDVMEDIVKIQKCHPQKIFIEMARGATEEQKNNRTKSRKEALMEIYKSTKTKESLQMIEELSGLGDNADNRLRSEKLYLYFVQMGRCMYCGKKIEIDSLLTNDYDVDHIWPQAFVKDDSIHNNKVLVHKSENGIKSDTYPINSQWQNEMKDYWKHLYDIKLITEEKYKRLIRTTPFTESEKNTFINRQIVETRQSTKAVAELLKKKYPKTEIVYVKAGLVSDFRHEYGSIKSKAFDLSLSNAEKKELELIKSRTINDMHHAYDAYLNIVVGNVYDERFSKRWFDVKNDKYSLNNTVLFGRILKFAPEVWNPEIHLPIIEKAMNNNHIHLTKYQTEQKGGLFDQMPKAAGNSSLIPLKNGKDVLKYGGYNKSTATFFALVKYEIKKKKELTIVPVDLLFANRFKNDIAFREDYIKDKLGNKAENIVFPLGNRMLKVNTVFSLDGFRACLSGKGSGGARVLIRSLESCFYPDELVQYIKKIEKVSERLSKDKKYSINKKYDGINTTDNQKLFDYLVEKINSTFFKKLPGAAICVSDEQINIFKGLSTENQLQCLTNLILYLKTNRAGSCSMELLKGSKSTGALYLSANISNWKYEDIRIIDCSASGLYETKSENLKDLL